MSSIWGENIRISVFGESHGAAIGVVIDGLPPGIKLDTAKIYEEMERRRPGQDIYSTPRKEGDAVEIVSGFFNGHTTGTPLCGIIRNTDKRSSDYEELKNMMRPGHADYTGRIRYNGFNDYRGGGHFSGRLTAPVVFAGAIAAQYLEQRGITIGTHLLRIGNVEDNRIDPVNIGAEQLKAFRSMRFPTIRPEAAQEMMKEINDARMDQDSVGGVLETAIINLPAGLGSPMFDSVESRLAAFVFAIPATKGIEFGAGFDFGRMRGSEANDNFHEPREPWGHEPWGQVPWFNYEPREEAQVSRLLGNEPLIGVKDPEGQIPCYNVNEPQTGVQRLESHEQETKAGDRVSWPNKQRKGEQVPVFCPTATNNTGGINGGITNGMPVIFRTVFRPTPSISKPQQALDIRTMEAREYSIHGRHDPCIAVRAVPVLDAVAALVVMDLLLDEKKYR